MTDRSKAFRGMDQEVASLRSANQQQEPKPAHPDIYDWPELECCSTLDTDGLHSVGCLQPRLPLPQKQRTR